MSRTRTFKTPFSTTNPISLMSMTDELVPDFYARRDRGELMCNPMSSIKYEAGLVPFNKWIRWYWSLYFGKRVDTMLTNHSFAVPRALCTSDANFNVAGVTNAANLLFDSTLALPSNLGDRLQLQCSADLSSGVSSTLVSLFEGHKTWRMLAKAARFLRRPFETAKRELAMTRRDLRSPVGRAAVMERASNLWLEYRYGWRPLVYDAMSQYEAAMVGLQPMRQTVRAKDAALSQAERKYRLLIAGSGGLGDVYLYRKIFSRLLLRAGQTADFKLQGDLSRGLKTFGFLDIIGTGWELIPYSFVVDRFIDVGNALKALQAFALIDERVGWLTLQKLLTVESYPHLVGPFYNDTTKYEWRVREEFPCRESVTWTTRTPVTNFLPSISSFMRVDLAFVVDAIALLRQVVVGSNPESATDLADYRRRRPVR